MSNQPIPPDELHGCYTAIITPFKKNENSISPEIDFEKLEMLIEDQIAAGVDGIVAAGTTGQGATLRHEEHVSLAHFVYACINGRTRFIASAGSNSTAEAIELSHHIEQRIGPTTFLHVTGYYNNPPQEGIVQHYTEIANRLGDSNLIMYNVPSRTHSNIEKEAIIALSEHPNIIGIKEAITDMETIREITKNTNPDTFRVFSGDDHLVASMMGNGAYGVISATANVAPRYFVTLTYQGLRGNKSKAAEIQGEIAPLVHAAFMPPAKSPMQLAYMFDTGVRLPLVDVSALRNGKEMASHIHETLSQYSPEQLGVDLSNYLRT